MKVVLSSKLDSFLPTTFAVFYPQEESKNSTPEKHLEAWNTLKSVDGVVLPGGFGNRGVEGKILTAK